MSTKTANLPSIDHLPPQHLLDLARNESAMISVRLHAAELLIDGGYKQANHPDIVDLIWTIKNDRAQARETLKEESFKEIPTEPIVHASPQNGQAKLADCPVVGCKVVGPHEHKITGPHENKSKSNGPLTAGVTTKNLQQDS